MEECERLKMRLACLTLAKEVSIATLNTYGIENLAEQYWQWLSKPNPEPAPAPRADDDIPF